MSRPRGLPKTGGRVKGTPNKDTVVLLKARDRLLEHIKPTSALDFLKAIYNDTSLPAEWRQSAAEKVIRYETPALAAITHSGHISTKDAEQITDDDLALIIASDESSGSEGAIGEAPSPDKPDRLH